MRGSRFEKHRRVPAAAKEPAPAYNDVKRLWEVTIATAATRAGLPSIARSWPTPIGIGFFWYERDRMRDPDGVSSGGRKLVLDGLVKAGVLPSDGAAHIDRFRADEFRYGMGEGVTVGFFHGVHVDRLLPGGIFSFDHRLPDLNELLAAREVGARRQQRART